MPTIPERRKAVHAAWRAKNKNKIKGPTPEQARECWQRNKDKYNAQRRARRAERSGADEWERKEQELKAHNQFMREWLSKPWRIMTNGG